MEGRGGEGRGGEERERGGEERGKTSTAAPAPARHGPTSTHLQPKVTQFDGSCCQGRVGQQIGMYRNGYTSS